MKIIRRRTDSSNILQIFIQDSSSTVGAGLTGLTSASPGLTAYYHKDIDTTATVIGLTGMTIGTFTSSGFAEVDSANMPGWYQFCPPNAALTTGKAVGFHLKGATNMAPLPIECQLVAPDFEDAAAFGLSNLDVVLSTRAPESGGNIAAIKAKTDQLIFTIANKVDASIQAAGDFAQAAADKVWSTASRTLTAFSFSVNVSAAAVQAIWDALTSALTTAGSIGKRLADNVDAVLSLIKAKTDNLPEGIQRAQALTNFEFLMIDSADHVTPKTGLTVSATRSLDGAAFSACTNSPTEVGSGIYKINLSAADLTGTVITFQFTSAGADPTFITLKTGL